MADYAELSERLRYEAAFAYLGEDGERLSEMMKQAADAIEELQQQVEHYHGCMNDWFEAAQEYKEAYIAEHDARIAEAKRLYDAFYECNKKAVELTPLKIVLPEPPKEEL